MTSLYKTGEREQSFRREPYSRTVIVVNQNKVEVEISGAVEAQGGT